MGLTMVAFDPGGTTGYVMMTTTEELADGSSLRSFGQALLVAHMQFPNWQKLDRLIQRSTVDTVVYEDFILYPWKAQAQAYQQIPSAEVIGVIKYLCQKEGVLCVGQNASLAKNARVNRNLDTSGLKPHEADALRHALCYLSRIGRL